MTTYVNICVKRYNLMEDSVSYTNHWSVAFRSCAYVRVYFFFLFFFKVLLLIENETGQNKSKLRNAAANVHINSSN